MSALYDVKLLYRGTVCKLCEQDLGEPPYAHTPACPGEILDNLHYKITYEGPKCARGCCGYDRGNATGDTLEECLRLVTPEAMQSDALHLDYVVTVEADLDVDVGKLLPSRWKAILAHRKALEVCHQHARYKPR